MMDQHLLVLQQYKMFSIAPQEVCTIDQLLTPCPIQFHPAPPYIRGLNLIPREGVEQSQVASTTADISTPIQLENEDGNLPDTIGAKQHGK